MATGRVAAVLIALSCLSTRTGHAASLSHDLDQNEKNSLTESGFYSVPSASERIKRDLRTHKSSMDFNDFTSGLPSGSSGDNSPRTTPILSAPAMQEETVDQVGTSRTGITEEVGVIAQQGAQSGDITTDYFANTLVFKKDSSSGDVTENSSLQDDRLTSVRSKVVFPLVTKTAFPRVQRSTEREEETASPSQETDDSVSFSSPRVKDTFSSHMPFNVPYVTATASTASGKSMTEDQSRETLSSLGSLTDMTKTALKSAAEKRQTNTSPVPTSHPESKRADEQDTTTLATEFTPFPAGTEVVFSEESSGEIVNGDANMSSPERRTVTSRDKGHNPADASFTALSQTPNDVNSAVGYVTTTAASAVTQSSPLDTVTGAAARTSNAEPAVSGRATDLPSKATKVPYKAEVSQQTTGDAKDLTSGHASSVTGRDDLQTYTVVSPAHHQQVSLTSVLQFSQTTSHSPTLDASQSHPTTLNPTLSRSTTLNPSLGDNSTTRNSSLSHTAALNPSLTRSPTLNPSYSHSSTLNPVLSPSTTLNPPPLVSRHQSQEPSSVIGGGQGVTTTDGIFTTQIETSGTTRTASWSSKVTSNDAFVSGKVTSNNAFLSSKVTSNNAFVSTGLSSRTRRQTSGTHPDTPTRLTTAEFSSTTTASRTNANAVNPTSAVLTTSANVSSSASDDGTNTTSADLTVSSSSTVTKATPPTTAATAAATSEVLPATTTTSAPETTTFGGFKCVDDAWCSGTFPNTKCINSTCQCQPEYYEIGISTCKREPYDLTAAATSKNCVRLTWQGDTNNNVTYILTVQSWPDRTGVLQRQEMKSLSHESCGFQAGSHVNASVVLSEGGAVAASNTVILEPSSPQTLRIIHVNETCLTAEWEQGEGRVDKFVVLVTAGEAPTDVIFANESTTESSWTQCGLDPGAEFYVKVDSLSGSVSSSVAATLGPDSTVPSTLEDAQWEPCTGDREHCISLQWEKGVGEVDRYILDSLNHGSRLNSTRNMTTVDQLHTGTRYSFNITAVAGMDRRSLPLKVEACTAPESAWYLNESDVGTTSATVSWSRPGNGSVDRYIITWYSSQLTVSESVDNASLQHTIMGLHPGTEYKYSIRSEFCGLNTISPSREFVTELSDLTSVNATSSGSDVIVTWTIDDDASTTGYYINVVVTHDKSVTDRTNVTTETHYTFDTETFGACFTVTLSVVKGSLRGTPSVVQVYTEERAPEQVTSLQANRLTNDRTAIRVTWSRPDVTHGVVQYYEVVALGQRELRRANVTFRCRSQCHSGCQTQGLMYTQSGDMMSGSDVSFAGSKRDFSYTLSHLSMFEDYTVEVKAATSAGLGPPATSRVSGQLLDAVRNLSVTAYNASCLQLDWSPPVNAEDKGTAVIGYIVEYQKYDDGYDSDNDDTGVDVTDTDAIVCGLDFWTEYSVNVTGKSAEGTGRTVSEQGTTKEHVPDKVDNVTVSVEQNIRRPRTLTVRWSQPTHPYGDILAYYVVVSKDLSQTPEKRRVDPTSHRNDSSVVYYQVEFRLRGAVKYHIEVWGSTAAGPGAVVRRSVTMPAGALPQPSERVNLTIPGPGQFSIGTHTVHVSLPATLLCNETYGPPTSAGFIVYRAKWTSAGVIKEGVSSGARPVVTEPWTSAQHTSRDTAAFFVPFSLQALKLQCRSSGGRTPRPISMLVGSDQGSGAELCGDGPGGQGSGGQGSGRRCGGPLRPDSFYRVLAVLCTSAACTYSRPSPEFKTHVAPEPEDESGSAGLAAGLSVVVLIALGALGAFFVYRKRSSRKSPRSQVSKVEPLEPMMEICRTRPVHIFEFIEHCDQLHNDSNLGFSAEYKVIKENSAQYSTMAADLLVNKPKNRYKNIRPWDDSRVKLLPTDDEEGSDYINASYLPGEKHQREFIAAQGPLPATVDDFWRMVWETRVSVMVMLTQCVEKGVTKCQEYWPEEGAQEIYGDLVVHVRSQSVLPDYIIRVIDVTHGNQSRMIKHFHFMRWPDHGCPEKTSMLLSFVSSVRAHMPHCDSGPMLVHCSAGVGRTGTFIALDQLLQQIQGQTAQIDIFGMVLTMREHRILMVQTENQYTYIHDCLADALTKDQESDEDQTSDDEDQHIYQNC